MNLSKWVRLPSSWIEEGGLRQIPWGNAGIGSNHTAALMTLTAIAHTADQETGCVRLTYDMICNATGLSRSKVSNGLSILSEHKIIERSPDGRSTFKLSKFDPNGGWAIFPARSMYSSSRIFAFDNFHLRTATELNALKLFFLFVARRGRDTNMANISFDKIESYTAIPRAKIKAGISLLATIPLVYVEQGPSQISEFGISNAYRIVGVNTNVHMATTVRGLDAIEF